MWWAVGLALITAIATITTLFGSSRKEKRGLLRHERLVVILTILTLGGTSYQAWKLDKTETLNKLLSVDWERDLDAPITDVRLSFLYPDGSTYEGEAARQIEALRFEFQDSSGTTTYRLKRGIGEAWTFSRNGRTKSISALVYGIPLKADEKRYCWWSDSWGDPGPFYFKDSNGKQWTDRSICSLQMVLPLADFPLQHLRSLADLKRVSVFLDKDPGASMMCEGECHEFLVSILLATKDNQFDISPLRDMQPTNQKGAVEWSSSGRGILNRVQLHFTQNEGMSIRESMRERMGPIDKLTAGNEIVRMWPPIWILPGIPGDLSDNKDFIAKFGRNTEIMQRDHWCGFADVPNLCLQQIVVIDTTPSKPK
jgi:nuclear transport factor 2 (NTF2) superfamily protein